MYQCTSTITFSHLADTFIQSDLQMRTMEAIKRATVLFLNYIINNKKADRKSIEHARGILLIFVNCIINKKKTNR